MKRFHYLRDETESVFVGAMFCVSWNSDGPWSVFITSAMRPSQFSLGQSFVCREAVMVNEACSLPPRWDQRPPRRREGERTEAVILTNRSQGRMDSCLRASNHLTLRDTNNFQVGRTIYLVWCGSILQSLSHCIYHGWGSTSKLSSCTITLSVLLMASVLAGSPSRSGDVAVYVFDINQPSLPTFFFLFCSCFYLSLWPFQLYFIS